MIKIVKGTYGYLDANGIVKPKTAADEPFALTAEQEARLVKKGVAVYVDATINEVEDDANDVTWDVGMKADRLREIAKGMGLTFPVGTTKVAMVEAMDKHMAAAEATGDGEEDPADEDEDIPTFDASEAVD